MIKKIFYGVKYCFTNINKYNYHYKLVSLLGMLIRVILLPLLFPNMFEVLTNYFVYNLHLPQYVNEILLRVILLIIDLLALNKIFYKLTYACVGNFYRRSSNPSWGSVCYTIFYFIHIIIPVLIIEYFTWLIIFISIIVYGIICFIFYYDSFKSNLLPENWKLRLILHCIICLMIYSAIIVLKIYVFC